LQIKNLNLTVKKAIPLRLENSSGVMIDGLTLSAPGSPLFRISGVRTGLTLLKNTGISLPEQHVLISKEVPAGMVSFT
jgi:hypothetical protein